MLTQDELFKIGFKTMVLNNDVVLGYTLMKQLKPNNCTVRAKIKCIIKRGTRFFLINIIQIPSEDEEGKFYFYQYRLSKSNEINEVHVSTVEEMKKYIADTTKKLMNDAQAPQ